MRIPACVLILSLFQLSFPGRPGACAQEWDFMQAMEDSLARVDNGFMSCKGKFFLLGGRGILPVAIYDPDSDTWSRGTAPPVEMHHFQAARIGGELWVVGALTGSPPDERPLGHIYVYNTLEDRWRREAAIPPDRMRGAAGVAVYRECLYVIGGSRDPQTGSSKSFLDRYDTKTGKWKKLADAPRERDFFHAGICDGKIYAAGGRDGTGPGARLIGEVDVYDIAKGRWRTLPPQQNIPTPRSGTSTVMALDHILVIGGQVPESPGALAMVEAYDVHRGKWEEWEPLNQGRSATQAVVCVGAVFIASGRGDKKGERGLQTLEKLEL